MTSFEGESPSAESVDVIDETNVDETNVDETAADAEATVDETNVDAVSEDADDGTRRSGSGADCRRRSGSSLMSPPKRLGV